MNDIALILPAGDRAAAPVARAISAFPGWRGALTYIAFALSVGFTFAVVLGIVN